PGGIALRTSQLGAPPARLSAPAGAMPRNFSRLHTTEDAGRASLARHPHTTRSAQPANPFDPAYSVATNAGFGLQSTGNFRPRSTAMIRSLPLASLAIFFLSSTSFGADPAPQGPADLIIHHSHVVTVDAKFRIAEAVAVKDGRILAVGKDDDILKLNGPKTPLLHAPSPPP